MRAVATALAFVLAIGLWSLQELEPPQALQVLGLISYVLIALSIGALGGWWTLPVTTAAFVVVTAIYQVGFWKDDLELTGIDDIQPLAGVIFILPWVLLLVAFGAALRQLRLEAIRGR